MKETNLIRLPVNGFFLGCLIAGVILTAFAIVYCKDLYRRLFIENKNLQKQQESLLVEKTQLILEDGTWASQVRIQKIAQQTLKMKSPDNRQFLKADKNHAS